MIKIPDIMPALRANTVAARDAMMGPKARVVEAFAAYSALCSDQYFPKARERINEAIEALPDDPAPRQSGVPEVHTLVVVDGTVVWVTRPYASHCDTLLPSAVETIITEFDKWTYATDEQMDAFAAEWEAGL